MIDSGQRIKRLVAEVAMLRAENARPAQEVTTQRAWAKSAHKAKERAEKRLQEALEGAG